MSHQQKFAFPKDGPVQKSEPFKVQIVRRFGRPVTLKKRSENSIPTLFDDTLIDGSPESPRISTQTLEEIRTSRVIMDLIRDFCPGLEHNDTFLMLLHQYFMVFTTDAVPVEIMKKMKFQLKKEALDNEIFEISLEGTKNILKSVGITSYRGLDRYILLRQERLKHHMNNPEADDFFLLEETRMQQSRKESMPGIQQ